MQLPRIIPPTRADRLHKREGLTLSAVNGSAIATYGQRSLTLNLGLCHKFHWIFVIANISYPLLGADFLHHFGLLVDMAHGKLIHTGTHFSIHGIVTEGTPLHPQSQLQLHKCTHPYSQNFRTSPGFIMIKTPLSSITLCIILVQPARRSPPVFDVSPQKNFKSLVRSSNTCWSWGSYDPLIAPGPLHCTWCPRSPREIGDCVVTTQPSTVLPHQTDILFPIFRIFQPPSMEPRFSQQ